MTDFLQPSLAIAPIRDALLRLDPSGMMLTSHHLLLVKLALESRAFNAATPVLEKYILYFPGSSHQPKPKFICDLSLAPTQYITASSGLTSKLKPVEILEYFHYSGMVYIGLRNWEMALECLENAVTYPAKEGAVSKVMAEAYKKWVLVGLLLEGKPLPLPKTTPGNASKQYHILGKPYGTVAQLFESASASRLKAEVEAGTRIWQNDCNTGLMLLVLSAYQKFQIKGLANIYSKISIQEIFNQTMSAETGTKLPHVQAAETLVRGMIQDGSLQATMSNSPNSGSILTFVAGRETLSEARMQQELVASMHRIQELTKEIKQTDRMLTHDKEYIKFAQKQKKNSKMSSGDQAVSMGGPSMDWSGGIEDEDLMGGLY
jgi:COP9 signalosome complex subunit 3